MATGITHKYTAQTGITHKIYSAKKNIPSKLLHGPNICQLNQHLNLPVFHRVNHGKKKNKLKTNETKFLKMKKVIHKAGQDTKYLKELYYVTYKSKEPKHIIIFKVS